MDEEHFEVCQGVVVPESVLIRPMRKDKYGSVPGLDDEELADPRELEQQIWREEWGPVLALPVPKSKEFNPAWDLSVDVDFNAFASIDFDRTLPAFDKIRYKTDKLREEFKDVMIMLSIVDERIPGRAKLKVLEQLRKGIIELDDITNDDMLWLGRYFLRARGLYKHIANLVKLGKTERVKHLKKWMEV